MFDDFPDRSATGSLKWDRYQGRNVLPFWVADMDFRSPPAVIDALRQRADHGVFGYTIPTASLVATVIDYLAARHRWSIPEEWLVWLPGLVPALNLACRAVEGGVITATPVYPPFLSAPVHAGRPLAAVPLAASAGRWEFDWDAMEAAVTPQTRLLLLCNPHNPVGRVYRPEELETLAEFAEKHHLIICSDEIHCDLILDPALTHTVIATLGEEIAARTISLFSPSKTYNLAGLACAYAVIPDPTLRSAFRQVARGIITEVNAMGYAACQAAYQDGEPWRLLLLEQLRQNRDRLYRCFARFSPPVSLLPMEATYLAWIDLRGLRLERPVAFLEEHGVGLSDGADFGAPGFARLNFGCPPRLLEAGLNRITRALSARHLPSSG